jgi:2-desacetyl-2-hydroxyethyl bacteriochlorophyllide A dehydrogenase
VWTSTMELSLRRVIPTQLIGRFWRGAYFSSFAPLQVQNIPRQPLPSPNWVRVRNRLAGICGSDLHLIYTDGDFRIAPAALPNHEYSYPGHEVVGEVIEVGDKVQELRVGDRVALQNGPNCLSTGVEPVCRSCAAGNYNLCERANFPGPYPFGGGWSEEMLLHEQQLFRIPSDMSDEQAVLLEPTAVAVHAVLRRLPRPGNRVLVIGAGTIGLLLLQVIHALVPQAETSVAARYPFQVEQATRLGAAHILYPQDGYQAVQRATGAQLYQGPMGNRMLLGGYDVIYDTIGKERTIHEALRWTRAGGAVVVVGVSLHLMHLDLTPVWYQEVDLIGTLAHGTETWPVGTQSRCSTFAIATEMILRGQLNPAQLITHRFPLSEYQRALITATDKADCRAIKVVFDYSLQPASVVPNVRTSSQRRLQTPALSAVPEPTVSGDIPGADVTEATDDKTVIVVKSPKRYPLKPGDRTVNG